MSCGVSGGVSGSVIKSLAMETRIGNVPLHLLQSTFIPWPEGVQSPTFAIQPANDYWGIQGGTNVNFDVEEDGGDLFLTPVLTLQNGIGGKYRAIHYFSTQFVDNPGYYSLNESEIYFRALPVINPTGSPYTWLYHFQMFDFDESGDPEPPPAGVYILFLIGSGSPPTIHVESADFTIESGDDFWEADEPYDPDVHRWIRFRHVSLDNTVVVETAPEACGSFSTLAVLGPYNGRLTSFSLEFLQDVQFDEANPAEIGYFGAVNQQPQPRELPLLTRIGDPKVPGTVIAELPLITLVNESSS